MSEKKLVSIIVNCHNGQKYLENCIKSILEQTYKNWELIFWDNASTDNSKKILKKFKDKRIKYYKSKKLLNLYEARNLAVDKSKGKYISFLDTDDLWVKDKLKKQINFLNDNKDFKIVFSNYYVLKESNKTQFIKHKFNLPSGAITQDLLNNYSLGILTVFLERNLFNNLKFKKNYNIIGDFDFFINISKKFKIASIQEPLAFYRIHESNYTSKAINLYIQEQKQWIAKNEKVLQSEGFNIGKQKTYLLKQKIKYFLRNFLNFSS